MFLHFAPPLTRRLVARNGQLFTVWSDGTVLPVLRGGDGEAVPLADLLAQATDENLSALDDDALATLDADITAAATALGSGDVDDEALTQLQAAAEAVQRIRAVADIRTQEAESRAAEAAAALAAIRGEDGDGGDGEGGETTDEPEEPAEPEAEPAPVTEPAPDESTDAVEPIAAGAARRRAPLTRVAARRPAAAAPRATTPAHGDLASLGLVASANAPGVQAGARITNYDQLAAAFVAAVDATKGYRHGPRVKVPVVRVGNERAEQYPEGYRLDSNTGQNMARIEAAQRMAQQEGGIRNGIAASENSRTAAGGICAPQQVNYDLPTVGVDDRPVRDGFLMRFGADRGGVRTIPPPTLEDVDDGAVDVWTELNDITPGDDGPEVKPCLTVTCPDEDETIVEAITRCLKTGNFRARFFPEQIEAWMRLVTVWQARFAELRLLATIAAGSTAVTEGQVLGTTRDTLAMLDRSLAVWRYNARLDDNFTVQWGAPRWLRQQMCVDIARQLPVGTLAETLAVADATIDNFFRTRNVDPVWFLDGEAGQGFTAQAGGALQAWPTTVKTYMAAPGAWLFLDGGTLDLGIMRDTANTATNDLQMFAETWEGAHFHSPLPSWTLTLTSCPSGSVSATTAVDCS